MIYAKGSIWQTSGQEEGPPAPSCQSLGGETCQPRGQAQGWKALAHAVGGVGGLCSPVETGVDSTRSELGQKHVIKMYRHLSS